MARPRDSAGRKPPASGLLLPQMAHLGALKAHRDPAVQRVESHLLVVFPMCLLEGGGGAFERTEGVRKSRRVNWEEAIR